MRGLFTRYTEALSKAFSAAPSPIAVSRLCPLCACADIAKMKLACAHCSDLLPTPAPRCPTCAILQPQAQACGDCLQTPPTFWGTWVGFDYAPPFDRIIQALKFGGQFGYADFLASAIIQNLPPDLLGSVDVLLPVPLSARRLRERGFNQAERLARAIHRRTGIVVDDQLVERIQDSPAQSSLSQAQRRQSLRSAFRTQRSAEGLRIAVIDDVITTGNTLEQIALVLRQAGAARVMNWVATRTPAPSFK